MKRVLAILAIVFMATSVWAAPSSVTWTSSGNDAAGYMEVTAAFTCHSSTGAFTTTPIYRNEADETDAKPIDFTGWWLYQIAYYYGTTAPTDNSDLVLNELTESGRDILYGSGANMIDNATNNNFQPWINGSESAMPLYGVLYMAISNNSVNSAVGTLVFKFFRLN